MKVSNPNLPEIYEGGGYCLLGAETLLTRTRELEDQLAGARKNNDIEYVHKLRVASRRKRAALDLFEECFGRKRVKKWAKTIRNVTSSSGAARDADVQIAFLTSYAKTNEDKNIALGLDYLITICTTRRRAMQTSVMKALDDLEASEILGDISHSCIALRGERNGSDIRTLATYGKAYDQISTKLVEVLALEPFVHDEGAVAKHHELRIAIKRLRYTMEIFSTLYERGLADQISLMKRFQDLLGEMHDCDVWIQEFNVEMESMPADARYGVSKVLTHLSETRKSRYMNFTSVWNDAIFTGQLDTIRQLTDARPGSPIVREILKRDDVKVALVADIHGNLDALNAVLADADRSGLTIFLNAGDAVGFGIYPSQVLRVVRSARFLSAVGNVDLETLEALRNTKNIGALESEIKELSPTDIVYLKSLPNELRLEIADKRILITHGTPDSVDEHIYPDSPEERLKEIAAKESADVIITGHSHTPMNRVVDGVTFINPGSVGRPVNGDPKAEYAVLSFNPLTVEFRRVSYDVEAVADQMRRNGLPESHVQVLLRGVPLKMITKQEEELEKMQLWKRKSTIGKVRAVARAFAPDESHAEQDRKLALMIFNKTKQLHSLGREERYWLECAAILHDIGLSRNARGHHKSTLRLILNDPQLPFTYKERYIIGSIARYHRKALPSKKHFNLKPVNQIENEKISILSSILRVADALDYSHKSVVQRVNVKSFPNHIVLECVTSGDHNLEEKSAMKKKDLFEKVFESELTLEWKPQPTRTRQMH
ncbi:MAG: YfcE family phosphodiesterase [Candidatus Bathyarchaeia archaeon]